VIYRGSHAPPGKRSVNVTEADRFGALARVLAERPGPPTPPIQFARCDLTEADQPESADEFSKAVQARADRFIAEFAEQLRRRPDAADHALGAYLKVDQARFDALTAFTATRPQCSENPECWTEASRAADLAVRPQVDEVARATYSTDRADIYALGMVACNSAQGRSTVGPCAQLSAAQWARLDPNNAIPWLFAAGEAANRGELMARDEALFRASQASFSNAYSPAFASLLQRKELQAQPLEVQAAFAVSIFGAEGATSILSYQSVMQFCSQAAVADPNRRQTCSDLASVMSDRADGELSLMLGIRIGERVGWPASRLDVLRTRKDAYVQFVTERIASVEVNDCESLRKTHSWVTDTVQYGDLGAFKRDVANGDVNEAELAERYRAERNRAEAQRTASAPEVRATPEAEAKSKP